MSVALVTQHAMHMHSMLSSLTCLTLTHFSTLSHKRYNFRGGGRRNEHKICFDFCINSVLILRRIQRDININIYRVSQEERT